MLLWIKVLKIMFSVDTDNVYKSSKTKNKYLLGSDDPQLFIRAGQPVINRLIISGPALRELIRCQSDTTGYPHRRVR